MSDLDHKAKQAAMDLAEDSREKEWASASIVAEIFRGRFRWDLISLYPEQDPDDKKIGDAYIEKLKSVLEKTLDPEKVDREGKIPPEAIAALGEIGAFGIKIPKEYGGLGFSQMNYTRVVAFLASYCASTASLVSAHQSIGVPQPLKLFGTPEQKKKYLPRLAKGEISAFALTEPGVGSDPAKMSTTAMPTDDGKHYIINGEKLWCTNAPMADVLVVMAVTPPKMVNGKEKKQVSAFIVEADTPGFEILHECSFMGCRGIRNAWLRFTDVKVPAENLIGQPGEGLKIAFTTLNAGRLSLPATAAVGGRGAIEELQDWVNERVQWGAPIGKHQAVAKKIANIAADTFAMDSINGIACMFVDKGDMDVRLEAAIAKYYCTEVGWRICDDWLQVKGGRGYETSESLRKRGENPAPVERAIRNARIARIVEGTSEVMQLFIAREAMDMHMKFAMPIFMGKGSAMSKLPMILKAALFYLRWYPTTWLPAGRCHARNLNNANQDHLNYIGKTAKRLARTMFHTMAKFGPKLEFEQLRLACFVDIGTELFAMAASLSHADRQLDRNRENDDLQHLVDLFCTNARLRIEENFRAVKRKNPNALINKVSRAFMDKKYAWMVQDVYVDDPPLSANAPGAKTPTGKRFPRPSEWVKENAVTKIMQPLREEATEQIPK
ncbi:MAG: putative acyl-CoA dehydrogenase FadE10 [Candidatus Hydrogenedentota bacterium]